MHWLNYALVSFKHLTEQNLGREARKPVVGVSATNVQSCIQNLNSMSLDHRSIGVRMIELLLQFETMTPSGIWVNLK